MNGYLEHYISVCLPKLSLCRFGLLTALLMSPPELSFNYDNLKRVKTELLNFP